MSVMSFYKVDSLPETLEPNALYFIPGGNINLLEIYATDMMGEYVRGTIGIDAIREIASTSVASTLVRSVSTYDDLATLSTTMARVAFVIDASGDPTVESGAATYLYNSRSGVWVKVAEFESMDISSNWANIQGKPSATPQQLDNAVLNSHLHSNKAILDKFITDAAGKLQYRFSETSLFNLFTEGNNVKFFNADGLVSGNIGVFMSKVTVTNGIWSVNYANAGFTQILGYTCSGTYVADGVGNSCIPTIDERTVTNTGLSGYGVTRVGAGALVAVELTKSDGFAFVIVIGKI